ncbi:MAG: hypothetical protein P4L46_06660 [Fimbriimonas sp.]|nr:hypothetical protein [Fimbriimonas sp.]
MFFCLRIDLDYVPWDTPDAKEFGHGEPAMLLRILELARNTGLKFHFFASNRVLRAFPANTDAVLNEGHDLDWFCKHPDAPGARFEEAKAEFAALGHEPKGFALRAPWPTGIEAFPGMEKLQFVSGPPGSIPATIRYFPVEGRSVRDVARTGITARSWVDTTKTQLREAASRNIGLTLPVRPQVLARLDPKMNYIKELLDLAGAVGMPILTLREVLVAQPR